MKQLTDRELVQLLLSGDSRQQNKAYRFFYRNYFGLIESLVVTNKGTTADAADIFNDGLIVLFVNVKNGKFQLKSTIKTYLYSICRNLWLMKLRKNNRETPLEDKHEYIEIEEDHLQTLIVNEKKEFLFNLLQELGESCRKILELFYYKGFEMEQIRINMNMASAQVAKNKKSRCMKRLRELYRKGGWE